MVTWRRQGRPATAGGLLILGLAGLALLIVFADGIRRGLRPTYRIHVLVADAPNVRAGTPVTVAGLSAGRVARVALAPLDDDSVANAVLSLELESAVRSQVRRDSQVRLRQRRFIGDPVVDVIPGSPTAAALAPGDTLRAGPRPRPDDAFALARALPPALDSLQRAAADVGAAWRATRPAAARLAERAAAAQAELRVLASAYRTGPLSHWMRQEEWRAALGRTRTAGAAIRHLFRNGGRPDGAVPGPDLARLATTAEALAAEFARLEAALASPAALPAGASRDTALANALRAARAELDSLIAETRRNPLRFFF
ncbi:MAG TPA: MCE family protein [Longimicrobiales bacterium]